MTKQINKNLKINDLIHLYNFNIEKMQIFFKRLRKGISRNLIRHYVNFSYKRNLVPYYPKEKIRILFLFQVASFWPSWESFYNACINDSRFDVKVILYDEIVGEKSQMLTSRNFLKNNNIKFTDYDRFNIDEFNPHIMVYQSPYDSWHRPKELWSRHYRAKGVRVMYITYGIEISDTEDARDSHFNLEFIDFCWRIYTFSEKMKLDYEKYCKNYKSVRALGQPKFDGLIDKSEHKLDENLVNKINGRKVYLWKVHFPKEILCNERIVMVTPYLNEYVNFAKEIENYKDIFFIFMPHPKFKEMCGRIAGGAAKAKKIWDMLNSYENAYIYEDDDYRPGLLNSDYIMVDRSAIMVESGAAGVPVLYLSNKDYKEPFPKAIEPLINSYYQGTGCKDMIKFIEMCNEGNDLKKEKREKAFKKCIPYFDGNCGKRIALDIIKSLKKESLNNKRR